MPPVTPKADTHTQVRCSATAEVPGNQLRETDRHNTFLLVEKGGKTGAPGAPCARWRVGQQPHTLLQICEPDGAEPRSTAAAIGTLPAR